MYLQLFKNDNNLSVCVSSSSSRCPAAVLDCMEMTKFFHMIYRLYAIAPNNSRILEEDIVLSGYRVPAGVSSYYTMSILTGSCFGRLTS